MKVVIEIAGKPEAKGRGRVGRVQPKNGAAFSTVFTPAHTRKYEAVIREHASRAMEGKDPITGAVEVFVHAYLPLPKSASKKKLTDMICGFLRPCTKPDIDNYVKAALDGVNGIIFVDDNQVVALHAHKVYRTKAALRIEVRELYSRSRAEYEKESWQNLRDLEEMI